MKITLVGNRDGKATIYWPGFWLATLLSGVIAGLINGTLCFWLDLDSPMPYILIPAMLGAMVVCQGVRRGLETPPEQLPPLNRAAQTSVRN